MNRVPISEMLVPPIPQDTAFIGRFCRCGQRKVGIVLSYKLVRDTRPEGKPNVFRVLWYGVNYITGRKWQSFDPKPLSTGELQEITWAWGGVITRNTVSGPKTRPSPRAFLRFAGKPQKGAKNFMVQAAGVTDASVQAGSAFLCNHANECPAQCTCPENCYCKSHTCQTRSSVV